MENSIDNFVPSSQKKIVSKAMAERIKNEVGIPEYFEKVIVPQLGSYYDNYPVDFDYKPVACCPLHDEDTPSFRFYPETNSFYCFGCQRGGNIITLHRYFIESLTGTQPSYEDAENYLYNTFIANRTEPVTSVIVPGTTVKEKLSTDIEVASYRMYRVDIEQSVLLDRDLSTETKDKIWSALDKIDVLVDKDLVNAKEAMSWAQTSVSKLAANDLQAVKNKLKQEA